MSFNVSGAVEVALEQFGSLVTEVAPPSVPHGCSPDCQDIVFAPGQFSCRPAMKRVFVTPFPGNPTVKYAKSYTDPQGIVRNLYLTSDGNLYQENVTSSAGIYSQLALTTPDSYAKSATAFGREYIAISDGLHGTEVPLQFDGTHLDRVTQDGPGASPNVASTVIPPVAMATGGPFGEYMVRGFTAGDNNVDVWTAAPHGLQVGYRVQITGVPPQGINFISSVVINNVDMPGIATVTLVGPHGLAPGCFVILALISPTVVGTGIISASRQGSLTTFVTSTPHGLSAGSQIIARGVADNSFNSTFTVATIVDTLTFSCAQADADTTSSGGTIQLIFPVSSDLSAPQYFEVLSCPSSTSFQVAINYCSGTWSGGNCLFAWDGTFFVKQVMSPNSFKYEQYGPPLNNTTISGKVTPIGQVAPGRHRLQVLFETRQGYVTAPSPPMEFMANGGQYLQITNLPIGPPNVVARILAFTGTNGSLFYYIPVPAQINGQYVSTATRIADNSTSSVVLDFSDNTLFASLSISIPGNSLAQQIVLDGALGFGYFDSRLITWGQRNRVNNLLNMGFDGGYRAAAPTKPLGWDASGSAGGSLGVNHYGQTWVITSGGLLKQSFYLDAYGAPIGEGNTLYRVRAWLKGAVGTFVASLTSASTGFNANVVLSSTSPTGAWVEGTLSNRTPAAIPSDILFAISGTSVEVDDISLIYAETPYTDQILYGSYVDNPEGFDGVSGQFGPSDDTHKVMDIGLIRNTCYIGTRDPGGRVHQVGANAVTEPVGWVIDQVETNCGLVSAFCLTKSQGDDATGSGGEEWLSWASATGARIFGGSKAFKISQEIQPDWDAINPSALLTVWACNDPSARVIYFGLPTGTNPRPNLIYPLNYRHSNTAEEIAFASPLVTGGYGRKLSNHELTRKWTRWNLAMNGLSLMNRAPGRLVPVFLCGKSFGNVYLLSNCSTADDDYGAYFPYYTTYFFVNQGEEAALQLGAHRKMLSYGTCFAYGLGYLKFTPLMNGLYNASNFSATRLLVAQPVADMEFAGGSATGQRIAVRLDWSPS